MFRRRLLPIPGKGLFAEPCTEGCGCDDGLFVPVPWWIFGAAHERGSGEP